MLADVSKLCQDLEGTIDSEVSEVSNEVIASTYFFDMDKIEEAAAALTFLEAMPAEWLLGNAKTAPIPLRQKNC
ncbi:MAG: hypothetical protein V8T31_08100 [Lachnospiraceae bacterium]